MMGQGPPTGPYSPLVRSQVSARLRGAAKGNFARACHDSRATRVAHVDSHSRARTARCPRSCRCGPRADACRSRASRSGPRTDLSPPSIGIQPVLVQAVLALARARGIRARTVLALARTSPRPLAERFPPLSGLFRSSRGPFRRPRGVSLVREWAVGSRRRMPGRAVAAHSCRPGPRRRSTCRSAVCQRMLLPESDQRRGLKATRWARRARCPRASAPRRSAGRSGLPSPTSV